MDLISFMVVVWFLKVLAEDSYSAVKGTPNPRIDRRRQRQRSRSQNRIWGALTNYLGDVAEDAREQAAEARRVKREKQRRERERQLAEEAPATTEVPDPEPVPVPQTPDPAAEPEVDLDLDDPKEEQQPEPEQSEPETTSPAPGSLPDNVIPFARPSKFDPKEHDMSTQINGEVTGLDPAIAYAKSLAMFAGEHGTAGNEGYIGFLQESKVSGDALYSSRAMQEAFDMAKAACEDHARQLEKQKAIQEQYNNNPDAGDKQFLQNGQ